MPYAFQVLGAARCHWPLAIRHWQTEDYAIYSMPVFPVNCRLRTGDCELRTEDWVLAPSYWQINYTTCLRQLKRFTTVPTAVEEIQLHEDINWEIVRVVLFLQ
jgi:hypothetical protein